MKIIYKVGDVLTTDAAFLVQGCNAQGVMGSGVAKAIRDLYPDVYTVYRAEYERSGLSLGDIVPVIVDPVMYKGEQLPERMILNAITQEFFGRDPNVVYVDYDAISSVFRSIARRLAGVQQYQVYAMEHGVMVNHQPKVAFPLIGAGLANGKWPEIARRIELESTVYQPVAYVESQEKLDEIMQQIEDHNSVSFDEDTKDFLIDLKKAAQSSDASDEWIAGFVRQFFRK